MRPQADVHIDVTGSTTADALAALAWQSQRLALGRTLRNAGLDDTRHTLGYSLLVEFGRGEVEAEMRAMERIFQRDRRRNLVVLPAHCGCRPSAPAARAPSGQGRQKTG